MSRQLKLWNIDPTAPANVTNRVAVEKQIETDRLVTDLQAAPRSASHRLFTNPNRQVAFADAPHDELPEWKLDRDSLAVNRTRDDIDGPAHRFAVKPKDSVEVVLDTGTVEYGSVIDISHARGEVCVSFGEEQEGIWVPIERVFPAPPPAIVRASDSGTRTAEATRVLERHQDNDPVTRRLESETRYTSLKCISLVWTGSMKGRPKLTSSAESKAFFSQYWRENPANDQERFVVACLDTKNCVQCVVVVTIGTLDASLVHPREVFKPALIEGSSSVVLSHNHPSGDTTPSKEDHAVTERLTKAGELLGITVLDHIIHGDGSNEVIAIRDF